jgi:hypothetical protein
MKIVPTKEKLSSLQLTLFEKKQQDRWIWRDIIAQARGQALEDPHDLWGHWGSDEELDDLRYGRGEY